LLLLLRHRSSFFSFLSVFVFLVLIGLAPTARSLVYAG
jgi:hypothetical protein